LEGCTHNLEHHYCCLLPNYNHYRCLTAGDEIDAQYNAELDEIVQLTDTPETAFSMFADIVKNLFDWDEHEGGE